MTLSKMLASIKEDGLDSGPIASYISVNIIVGCYLNGSRHDLTDMGIAVPTV